MKVTITIELGSTEELLEWAARFAPATNGHAERATGPLEDLVPPERLEDTRPWKPAADILETNGVEADEITKICRNCKKEFTASSKIRVLCNECFFEAPALRPDTIKRAARHSGGGGRPPTDRSGERYVMEGIKHGVAGGYKRGCRCWPCTDAKSAENKAYDERRKARA